MNGSGRERAEPGRVAPAARVPASATVCASRAGTGPDGMPVHAPWSAPWFAPYRPLLDAISDDLMAGRWARCIAHLNDRAREAGLVNGNGRALRFAAADAAGDAAYEAHIWATGEVPTRTGEAGGWHDLFNALVWLTFPRTKARLNRLQAGVIAAEGVRPGRGGLRDAATLFDENAALLVTDDPGVAQALRDFDWPGLFVTGRARFATRARVVVFGHALLDKLRAPYKAACAHAWFVGAVSVRDLDVARAVSVRDLDAATAATLDPATLRSAAFSPLPVLGIPGWWPANAAPAFYDDPRVFRSGRRSDRRS